MKKLQKEYFPESILYEVKKRGNIGTGTNSWRELVAHDQPVADQDREEDLKDDSENGTINMGKPWPCNWKKNLRDVFDVTNSATKNHSISKQKLVKRITQWSKKLMVPNRVVPVARSAFEVTARRWYEYTAGEE